MDLRSTNERLRRSLLLLPISGSEDKPEDKKDKPEEQPEAGADGADPPVVKVYSQEEWDALQLRMREADRAKSDVEKKLLKIEDAEKTELEKAKSDLERANQRAEAAEKRARDATIHAEILKQPTQWHDRDAVIRLIDMETIRVEEDGSITGVKEAVTNLAKKSPYLVKPDGDEKGKGKQQNGTKEGAPSGHSPGSGAPDGKSDQRAALMEKYPILNQ